MIDLSPLAKRIKAAAQITVVTHRRPDGDAVGSALGLAFGIESAYPSKRVTLLCADPIPRRLAFLAHGREMETVFLPFPRPELVIAVDVASGSLLGEMQGQIEDLVDVKLDHHLGGEDFAPLCLVDPTASAAGEMVFDLLSLLDAPQDEEKRLWAMTALYAAIASDCGSFRYSNVTPRTHEIAAALIRAGVDGSAVCHALFESLEAGEVRATRCAYEKLSFHLDGRIALIVVTLEDRKKWQLDEEMLGLISAIPRTIGGVELGLVLRRMPEHPNTYKISARSGETVDARALCAEFGGGGHLRAAGGEIRADSPEEAEAILLEAAIRRMTT